jgi:PAS domain S-box-containing protein
MVRIRNGFLLPDLGKKDLLINNKKYHEQRTPAGIILLKKTCCFSNSIHMKDNLYKKLIIIVFILLSFLILQVFGITAMYNESHQTILQNSWHEMENLATLIASQIDGDALSQIREGDENTTQYQKMIHELWEMQNKHADIRFIYTLIKKGDKLAFVTDSEYGHNDFSEPLIGYIYDDAPPEAFSGFKSVSLRKTYYTDEWGTYMSAFAPVKNKTGDTVAIVGVDIPKDVIENRLRSIVNIGYIILIATTIISFLLILLILYGVRVISSYQKKLEESEKKIQMALDIAEEGIWEYDIPNNILHMGGGFWKSLGRENPGWDHAVPLDKVFSYIHPEDMEKFSHMMNKIRENYGPDRFVTPIRFRAKDGTYRWIQVTGKVVAWVDHTPQKAIGTTVDLTDIRQYQDELQRMYEKLVIFDSLTRHDIANKNAVISLASEELTYSEPGSEEQKRWLSEISKASEGITKLITFATTYRSLGSGKPRWNDIDTIINSLIEEEQDSSIRIVNECRSLYLYADPLISRALYNLYENAIRHAGPYVTSIKYRYRIEGTDCIVCIEDDGEEFRIIEKKRSLNGGLGRIPAWASI